MTVTTRTATVPDVPIPFDAFATDTVDLREPDDVVVATLDATPAPVAEAWPGRRRAAGPRPRLPLRAAPGRVVLALRSPQGRSREVEELVTRTCAVLAPGDDLLAHAASRPHAHDPAAARWWAQVDAARARAVAAYDLTACAHPGGVLTIDAPAGLLWPVLLAVRTAAGRTPFVLTEHGPGRCRDDAGDGTAASVDLVRACADHAHRQSGTALVFAGQQWLRRDLSVLDVLAHTAVDAVVSSSGPYAPDAVLAARGHVRPSWEDGRLVVRVGHDDPRVLVPWEVRSVAPCCGGE